MLRLAFVGLSLCCLTGIALAEPLAGPAISGFQVVSGADGIHTVSGRVDGPIMSGTIVVISGALGDHTVTPAPDGSFAVIVQKPGASGTVTGTASSGGQTGPPADDVIND